MIYLPKDVNHHERKEGRNEKYTRKLFNPNLDLYYKVQLRLLPCNLDSLLVTNHSGGIQTLSIVAALLTRTPRPKGIALSLRDEKQKSNSTIALPKNRTQEAWQQRLTSELPAHGQTVGSACVGIYYNQNPTRARPPKTEGSSHENPRFLAAVETETKQQKPLHPISHRYFDKASKQEVAVYI
eukprot:scaffold5501_cov54-Cylindrotheca_fusiformis.AAC.2